jgi:hypothetical protein
MRLAFLLVLLAPVALTGCDNVQEVLLAKDPMKAQAPTEKPPRPKSASPSEQPIVPVGYVSAEVAAPASGEADTVSITPEDLAVVMVQSEKYVRSMLEFDPEGVVDLIYPPLVDWLGGRDQVVRQTAAEIASLQGRGVVVHSFQISEPTHVHQGKEYRAAFVPAKIRCRLGGQEHENSTYLLAISHLDSEFWYVMDGTRLTRQTFRQAFFGFPKSLELPPVTQRPL